MKTNAILARTIFKEIGRVRWSKLDDAFAVKTELGARLMLSPILVAIHPLWPILTKSSFPSRCAGEGSQRKL